MADCCEHCNYVPEHCEKCDGKGKYSVTRACGACGGKGWYDELTCASAISHDCKYCNKTGKGGTHDKECEKCYGTGEVIPDWVEWYKSKTATDYFGAGEAVYRLLMHVGQEKVEEILEKYTYDIHERIEEDHKRMRESNVADAE